MYWVIGVTSTDEIRGVTTPYDVLDVSRTYEDFATRMYEVTGGITYEVTYRSLVSLAQMRPLL